MSPQQKLFQIHELEISELIPAASLTTNSGATLERRDIHTERDGTTWRLLIECKCTQKKSYRLTNELWSEVHRTTLERGSEFRPAIALRFIEETPRAKTLADLIVLDVNDFVELLTEVQKAKRVLNESPNKTK